MVMDRKLDSSMEGLERRLDGALSQIREEIGAQLQQFMVMFTRQNSVGISPNFPPRERTDPILPGNRINNRMTKTSKLRWIQGKKEKQ